MRLLDLTLESPAANLALDDAVLDQAEAAGGSFELLRLWEPNSSFVVIGRASRIDEEVELDACQASNVPVFRRASGGAAIVTGQGCLMYAVVLSLEKRPHLRMVDQAHCFVLGQLIQALARRSVEATCQGSSDLVIDGRKVSGNSLRCKRTHLLYHGTLLCDFSLPLIGKYLKQPPRQPDYRRNRAHGEFVRNLQVPTKDLREALIEQWRPSEIIAEWPEEEVRQIVAERYSQRAWNHRL